MEIGLVTPKASVSPEYTADCPLTTDARAEAVWEAAFARFCRAAILLSTFRVELLTPPIAVATEKRLSPAMSAASEILPSAAVFC